MIAGMNASQIRAMAAAWIPRILPVEKVVPEAHARWRPLVGDAIQFLFTHLSDGRLLPKLAEQVALPGATPWEERLLRMISRMPALQKLGQVLARNRRIEASLREALTELENGISDVTTGEIQAIIREQLGARLENYAVEVEPSLFKEGSASAVVRFVWTTPEGERERGVFKVLKPYARRYFAEDLSLLQELGDFLASRERGYGFAVRDVRDMLAEVRLLLERELDFAGEQATLPEVARMYRPVFGIRVPRLIGPLCTPEITAMTAESGVKVTEACPRSPVRRSHIAGQLIEALVTVPLFSPDRMAVFHADPHAGNLLYDEANRELILIDWALAERLSLATRRRLVMLVLLTGGRNVAGVAEMVRALAEEAGVHGQRRLIDSCVRRFFAGLPAGRTPGALDAMGLLDEAALRGVRFPASLFLFRKILFTLEGVLEDVAGSEVRMDEVVAREFVTRWLASFGVFHAPLSTGDVVKASWSAIWGQAPRSPVSEIRD